jgi:hypothetical protein
LTKEVHRWPRAGGVELVPGSEGDLYNFGERPQAGDAIALG